jgi:hypothetical protein
MFEHEDRLPVKVVAPDGTTIGQFTSAKIAELVSNLLTESLLDEVFENKPSKNLPPMQSNQNIDPFCAVHRGNAQ